MLSSTNIRFSVCVPVYNVEKYLRECLDSLSAQSYGNFEVILVDDGSADNSGAICDEYAMADGRFRVFHNENHGQLYSRNFAVQNAQGEYCVFLDSDDMLVPRALSCIDEAIEQYGSDCIVYGLREELSGKTVRTLVDDNIETLTGRREIYLRCLCTGKYNSMCRKAVRRTVFDGRSYEAYHQLRLGEDLVQSIEVFQQSREVTFINEVLYIYRVNPKSVTHFNFDNYYHIKHGAQESVLDVLRSEPSITGEDLIPYRQFCLELLFNELAVVAKLNKPIEDRLDEYAMYYDDYYLSFLKPGVPEFKGNPLKTFILRLFDRQHFLLVLTMCVVYCALLELRDRSTELFSDKTH